MHITSGAPVRSPDRTEFGYPPVALSNNCYRETPPMITKAVILAAGRGKRMRELTNEVPKPMVEVRGKPILHHILDGLGSANIEEVLIVVGYRKEAIQDYFGDGQKVGLHVEYVEQVTQ